MNPKNLKIEKGVSIPESNWSKRRSRWGPLVEQMGDGDSVFIPGATHRIGANLRRYIPKNLKLVVRKRTEGGLEGVRVWTVNKNGDAE